MNGRKKMKQEKQKAGINKFICCLDQCTTLSNRSHPRNGVDQPAEHFSYSFPFWSNHIDVFH